jgi:hypothetical protein
MMTIATIPIRRIAPQSPSAMAKLGLDPPTEPAMPGSVGGFASEGDRPSVRQSQPKLGLPPSEANAPTESGIADSVGACETPKAGGFDAIVEAATGARVAFGSGRGGSGWPISKSELTPLIETRIRNEMTGRFRWHST